MAPERAPYLASRHGQPTKPIGKPFNGQAKGLFWLTWRSYAGPPQYYNSRGRKPSTRPGGVSRSRTEPWQPRAERPGGWLSPHARKGVSTFGNTGKHRPADWYLSRDDSLPAYTEILRFTQDDEWEAGLPSHQQPATLKSQPLYHFLSPHYTK